MDDLDEYERDDAQPWLDMIADFTRHNQPWQDAVKNIEKQYADLSRLRGGLRDREFALFWSNVQVIAPSIYARPPVPSVTPRFKDRRPLYRVTSEFLERGVTTGLDLSGVDEVMMQMRDDLVIAGRGVGWIRYEDDGEEKVCVEHVNREDFGHTPARKWSEVDAVWKASWLTKDEMKARFGDEVSNEVDYSTKASATDRGIAYTEDKCRVWEIWCKSEDAVIWVTDGYPDVLDRDAVPIKLEGFFPCPRPAYGTLQPGTLTPIPDYLQYRDQLEEINDLTRRIHALANAVKVRGFYAGGADIGAAIERAVQLVDDDQIMIPVPNLNQLTANGGEPIIWLPIEMVSNTIASLIELRRQIIDDVYQIMGLSDIMRGATEASETYGAQQLKQQNGSVRVRDKQKELTRFARDLIRIMAEIMAEEFDKKTLADMSQMELPTDAEIKDNIKEAKAACEAELKQLLDQAEEEQQPDPQMFQQAQQEVLGKYSEIIKDAERAVTIDQVMDLLRDQKIRPFVLDVESDSTVYPDEQAEKASRVEFLTAFNSQFPSLAAAAQMGPEALALAGGVFKFALAPFRVGRELDGMIDDLVDSAPQVAERMAQQNNPGDEMAEANQQLAQAELQKAQAQTMKVEADAQLKAAELQQKQQEFQAKAGDGQRKQEIEIARLQSELEENRARTDNIQADTQLILSKIGIDGAKLELEAAKAVADQQSRRMQQDSAEQQRAIDNQRADVAQDQEMTNANAPR